jgi:hypothetical protein
MNDPFEISNNKMQCPIKVKNLKGVEMKDTKSTMRLELLKA